MRARLWWRVVAPEDCPPALEARVKRDAGGVPCLWGGQIGSSVSTSGNVGDTLEFSTFRVPADYRGSSTPDVLGHPMVLPRRAILSLISVSGVSVDAPAWEWWLSADREGAIPLTEARQTGPAALEVAFEVIDGESGLFVQTREAL